MRHSISRACRTALLVAAALTASAAPQDLRAQSPTPTFALAPGDVIRITVWRKPEFSGEFRIMADGSIGHPLYQAINVGGVALPSLTNRVREFLSTYEQNPQVILEPLVRVSVSGEVRQPNLLAVPVGTTLAQALAQAGGGTETANLGKVRLVRGSTTRRVDLRSPGTASMPVESGDQIVVGRRVNIFRDVIGPFASVLAAGAAIVSATR